MAEKKQKRGRPKTRLPNPARLRCEVSAEEAAEVRVACERTGEPQWLFCGKAAVERARRVNRKSAP